MRRALPCVFAFVLVASASSAAAYERQITLDVAAGWGIAPTLEAPNNGPEGALGASIGFDDTWGAAAYVAWAVHPPFNGGDPLHLGFVGIEGLYYIDILQLVPFFGIGVDLITSFDGDAWGADFAAHARLSLDYLVSREVVIGLDVRPYVLFTDLSLNPVYISALARLSFVLDY